MCNHHQQCHVECFWHHTTGETREVLSLNSNHFVIIHYLQNVQHVVDIMEVYMLLFMAAQKVTQHKNIKNCIYKDVDKYMYIRKTCMLSTIPRKQVQHNTKIHL